ncbi:polysaccharide deacetylase family protein [Ruegeria sediminis]|uniref:Chitooligosaccharide deacetylase n=1 Tax=Ruegeria sediminis TaxID=2583820 RepID=A0ABY2WX32_9RHOB|nr:polysaccharide deacetylase family protein [Ruegeria sediminis]TMV07011.1 polysaccharide deacetylase family protein [Ruegeria sediminis]
MKHLIALNFHGIGPTARILEDGESRYWMSEAQFLSVVDRIAGSPDPKAYVLTFDDGNLSDYEVAVPALLERGLHAIFFILTGRLDKEGSLERRHLTALVEAGMKIGSHGIAHVDWTSLNDDALHRELSLSRDLLQKICGHPVNLAGIPFGRYDARVLRFLRQTGYTASYSSDAGLLRKDAFLRPRTSLRGDMTQAELEAVLAGRMPQIKQLRRAFGMARRRFLPLG